MLGVLAFCLNYSSSKAVWASKRRNAWSACFLLEDTRRMVATQWLFGRAREGMLGVLAFCSDYSRCLLA